VQSRTFLFCGFDYYRRRPRPRWCLAKTCGCAERLGSSAYPATSRETGVATGHIRITTSVKPRSHPAVTLRWLQLQQNSTCSGKASSVTVQTCQQLC
jgi:hypothetical protein